MRGAKTKMRESKLNENMEREEYVLNAMWWRNLQESLNYVEDKI